MKTAPTSPIRLVVLSITSFSLGLLLASSLYAQPQLTPKPKPAAKVTVTVEELTQRYPGVPSERILDYANRINRVPTVRIDSNAFNGIVQAVFGMASFSANSCGNVNDSPHELRFAMPSGVVSRAPLDRLDYTLTGDEKNATEGAFWSGIPFIASIDGTLRTRKIRACVETWRDRSWLGVIENGKLQINVRVESTQLSSTVPGTIAQTTPLVKTRRIVEYKYSSAPFVGDLAELVGWLDLWEWNHPGADTTIKDYHNGITYLMVSLFPTVQANTVSYGIGEVTWYSQGSAFRASHTPTAMYPDFDFGLFDQVPTIRDRIVIFNTTKKEFMREFMASAFDSSPVKQQLSSALTAHVRSLVPQGATLDGVYGLGDSIRIGYEVAH